MFENILFDFDGTIMDTSPGVYDSFDKVVEHYKLDYPRSEYHRMIGPPIRESFRDFLKIPESEIENAIKVYRDYYSVEGMYNGDIYRGIIPLMERLRKAGKKIFTATSKPEVFTKQIIERKGMLDLFDFIGGSDISEKGRTSKEDVVKYVLETQGLSENISNCILIGDRYFDVVGAHAVGMKCAGILWGFGSRKEFEEAGADWILETPEEVEKFLLS
ncbi:HAD hydrolase-like protein [Treponema sp.]|uniref:HAD hydrolase-like protein n=1 Tax=Treponema sp. TaxID=166 RepID=UPI00298E3142|nr:HAD hydrolase-like protein [Treponema sp.]MCQ2241356.1 HAD hydrolase-like protein [Treponema sp.]